MREALAALSSIEAELVGPAQSSLLMGCSGARNGRGPAQLEHHYTGDEQTMHLLRRYSYSDRVRYYWNAPLVKEAWRRSC